MAWTGRYNPVWTPAGLVSPEQADGIRYGHLLGLVGPGQADGNPVQTSRRLR